MNDMGFYVPPLYDFLTLGSLLTRSGKIVQVVDEQVSLTHIQGSSREIGGLRLAYPHPPPQKPCDVPFWTLSE